MMARPDLTPLVETLLRRSQLASPERAALLSLPCTLATYDRAGYIAREREYVAHSCVLLNGLAYSHKNTGVGTRQIVALHMPGDLLDFQHGTAGTSACNIQPLGPVSVALVPRLALANVACEYPQIGAALWTDAGANASALTEWMVSLGRRDARGRIAHLICEQATVQQASALRAGPDYIWPMSQEQLADATGLTTVHVNRTMQGLRRDRLIRTSPRQVTILDWEGLAKAADFSAHYLQLRPGETARREFA